MVFIRIEAAEGAGGREQGAEGKNRVAKPGPAAGFRDVLELGARSGRPRRVCGQSQ